MYDYRTLCLKVDGVICSLEQELKLFPTLQSEIVAASYEALERFRTNSKRVTLQLVNMELSYLTVDFFRRLPPELEIGWNPIAADSIDRYSEGHYRRIAANVSSYVGMVSDTLRNTIPKAVAHCQVREAKQSLLDHFLTRVGEEVTQNRPLDSSEYFCLR